MREAFKKAAIGLAVCLFLSSAFTASAATPYENYIYNDSGKLLESPPGAIPGQMIDGAAMGTGSLSDPQDLFVDSAGYLYIADTGNNRVLKLDKTFRLVREYKEFSLDGETSTFLHPQGVFVDEEGNLLVADTDNKRLVKLNAVGGLLAVYGAPESQLLPGNFDYKPVKVTGDSAGRLFVVSKDFNRGLLELDRNGKFVQMLGASEAVYSLTDRIWRALSTKAQIDRMKSFVPTEYNNVSIDDEDFIFTTTGTETATPVRRINAKGTDMLRREEGNPQGDLITNSTGTVKGSSTLVDVTNLSNGMYATLDQKRGRVFVYDQDGQILFLFGGLGQTFGTTKIPTSLVYYNGEFLVLDSGKNCIVTYRLTEYGQLLIQAEEYRNGNEYEKEAETWNQILRCNENSPLVLRELGKIAYQQRDMETALRYFKQAKSMENYSKAFKFHRRNLINQYFTVGGITLISLAVVLIAWRIFMKRYWRPRHPKPERKGPFRYAFYVIFRPLDGFWDLKRENRGSLKVALGMIAATGLVFILRSQFTGFLFNPSQGARASIFIDLATLLVPLLLWVVSNWCVTSLMSGEGSFRDIVTATGYAMTPLVILLPVAILLSNLISLDESGLYTLIVSFASIWMVILIVAGVKQTQNYSMGRTMGTIFLSLLVIVIIVFLGLLCTALIQQIAAFVQDINSELLNRL